MRYILRRESAASRAEWFFALSFLYVLVITTVEMLPLQNRFIGVLPGFLQAYAVVLGLIECLSALLLVWRASAAHDGRLAVLAAAYMFSAPLIVANGVTLPDVFYPAGTFGRQTSATLWFMWHVGFATGMLIYALHLRAPRIRPTWLAAAALGCAMICMAVAVYSRNLPALVGPENIGTIFSRVGVGLILLPYCVVLAALIRRRRSLDTLELWVGIAVVVLVSDIVTTLISMRRYTSGFYFSHALSVVSGFVVLAAICTDLFRTVRRADVIDGYAAVMEQLPVIACIIDVHRSCTFVNPAWEHLTGQSSADALHDGYRSALHPDDVEMMAAMHTIDGDRQIRLREKSSGLYRRHLVRSVALTSHNPSLRDGAMMVAIDVEDGLHASETRDAATLHLQAFLDIIPQIAWTADASGWIDWYNPAWYSYTGIAADDSFGWGWQSTQHPDELTAVIERWTESINSGRAFEMEYRMLRHDGMYEWFLSTAVAQRDTNGVIIRWFGSHTNIDAQKRESERSNRIARVLQEAFLPERLPSIPGVQIDAVYRAAESEALVGGDWYDVIALPDGRVLLSCGDVVGHGLGAATLAGRYRQSIAVTGVEDPEPGRVIERVNRIAMLQDEGLATVVVAVFDPHTLHMQYAMAGHPGPIVAMPEEEVLVLTGGDLPIGVIAEAEWRTGSLVLCPHSIVLFYTDGITEFARDALSAERLLCAAASDLVKERSVHRIAASVVERVLAGALPSDDIAVLALRCSDETIGDPNFNAAEFVKTWRFHSSDAYTAHTTRLTLTDFLTLHAAEDARTYEAELVVGEIIANTVEHAPGLVEIRIDWTGLRPLFIARDSGPGISRFDVPAMVDLFSEDGRGLYLIHKLAIDVVVRRAPGYGTEIRCTLPIERNIASR